ncbi:MAG: site-2 protease family protein [Actinomycetota bacterium]
MFGRSYRVATIGGVPIHVDGSWLWIAVFITYNLWVRFHAATGGPVRGLALAVVTAILFFGSVLLHELAHALAARAQGITVFGITLVIFGGFTATRADERGPGPAFAIAAVGPATSLAVGGIFWLAADALGARNPVFAGALRQVGWVNLFMAGFNILPGLPLDGGRMLQTAVWRFTGRPDLATKVAARAGIVVAIALFGAGLLEVGRGDLFGAIWLAIIGAFIFQGARGAETSSRAATRLASGRVRDVMDPPPPTIDAELALSDALDRFLRGSEERVFPVVDGGALVGALTFASARSVGVVDPLRPVRDALVPLADLLVLHPDDALDAAGTRLTDGGTALVVDGGVLVGTLRGERLIAWAERRGD